MAITQEERDELRALARRSFGDRGADLLMAGLAAADLAGMEERLSLRIDNARLELRTEIAGLRTELKGEIRRLEGRIDGLDGRMDGLDGRMDGLDGRMDGLDGRMAAGFSELRAEMAKQGRGIFVSVFSANLAVAGLVLGAVQVFG